MTSDKQMAACAAKAAATDLYAKLLYRDVIADLDSWTLEDTARFLNHIGAPRLRGSNPWTPDAVSQIRKRVAYLRTR